MEDKLFVVHFKLHEACSLLHINVNLTLFKILFGFFNQKHYADVNVEQDGREESSTDCLRQKDTKLATVYIDKTPS